MTTWAAQEALPSLVGMALDCDQNFASHAPRRKVGIITRAEIRYAQIQIEGYLFARDFPEVVREIREGRQLGLSFELADAYIASVREKIWTILRASFTGVAVLQRTNAAYGCSSIAIADDLNGDALQPATGDRLLATDPSSPTGPQSSPSHPGAKSKTESGPARPLVNCHPERSAEGAQPRDQALSFARYKVLFHLGDGWWISTFINAANASEAKQSAQEELWARHPHFRGQLATAAEEVHRFGGRS